MSRRKAERRWRSSGLTVDKEIYDSAKKAITTIVHNAKCAYYSVKLAESSNTSNCLASLTSWWQGIAKHLCQQNISMNFQNCSQIFSVTRFKQLEIISINHCQRLTRTHHMPMTTNSLVVHLIVSLRSWKIHYEKLYFIVLVRLVNWMIFQHCFLNAWMQYCLHWLLLWTIPSWLLNFH